MTQTQIHRICVHHGVQEWETEISQMVFDCFIVNRDFGRLLRQPGRIRDAINTIKTVLSAPYAWFFERVTGPSERTIKALQIAGE